jgi:bacillithiol biosynthesis cysteine-adding enzyme BshC
MDIDTGQKVQFKKSTINFGDTGFFSPIVLDYLSGSEKLKAFYGSSPNPESFKNQMEFKSNFEHRQVLVDVLHKQYKESKLKSDSITSLLDENTFTVTTGHQVCLFTGPLYFIFKIISAINTCKRLKESYPDNHFVPVFWMATEDHDFEEANHFFTKNRKVEWESGQGGAVGRMSTVGMKELAEELKDAFGVGYHAAELHQLFERAYTRYKNIAEATRFLVHELFGAYGVVSIDADDAELKALAIPYFKKEFESQTSFKEVEKTNAELGKSYDLQVTPREINLFYLDNELRERIISSGEGFTVNHTDLEFTREEIIQLLNDSPEKFSPNVVLRPFYQEVILPNLAYIGGGGELAYWFQLKGVFDAHEVPFPILMLRNSAMIIESKVHAKMKKLGLTHRDLFLDQAKLEKLLISENSTDRLNLDKEMDELQEVFYKIEDRLKEIDPTLERSAKSGLARTERIVQNLKKKMFRATRKKEKTLVDSINQIKSNLFPSGGLQERRWNFSVFYAEMGDSFIRACLENLDPFDASFTLLTEE